MLLAKWVEKSVKLPDDDQRVLTFSPAYAPLDPFRFRIAEGQFVRIMTEVTHWLDLAEIEPN